MFLQMQQQLQNQTRTMFTGFGFPGFPQPPQPGRNTPPEDEKRDLKAGKAKPASKAAKVVSYARLPEALVDSEASHAAAPEATRPCRAMTGRLVIVNTAACIDSRRGAARRHRRGAGRERQGDRHRVPRPRRADVVRHTHRRCSR